VSAIKKGTKLTDNPKDFMLRVRLDEQTLAELDYCCEVEQASRSEVVRQGIHERYAKAKK
jgi:metal-responsive CopG/Arc/MetJ family transcriptional regulator